MCIRDRSRPLRRRVERSTVRPTRACLTPSLRSSRATRRSSCRVATGRVEPRAQFEDGAPEASDVLRRRVLAPVAARPTVRPTVETTSRPFSVKPDSTGEARCLRIWLAGECQKGHETAAEQSFRPAPQHRRARRGDCHRRRIESARDPSCRASREWWRRPAPSRRSSRA